MSLQFSGKLLRRARVAAGLKQDRLATLIDRTVFTIYEYERDRSTPTVAVLASLAMTLGVGVEEFFADVEADGDSAA
jgi:transcriptional regulator with XRE-family HTH domain